MPFAVYALRKSYAGVEVLKGVDLTVSDGEIHALLGANGAGKSTLIKCLSGAIQPDSGGLLVGAERFDGLTPKSARQAGVAVIYQDPALASSLDVADNMFLGREKRFGPFVRRRAQREEAAFWLKELDADIRPTDSMTRLGNASLQTIEIAKSLSMNPKVLILDEPTAALSEHEANILGQRLLELKKQKLPVLYVTHRLAEVFALADRVTVLRGGEVVLSGLVSDFSHDDLVDAIAGAKIERTRSSVAMSKPFPFVKIDNLVAPGIGPVSFEVGRGEIVGVFGLVGSGRTELLETLFGIRQRHTGKLSVDGVDLSVSGPASAVAAGIALVPSDRLRKSIIGSLSSGDNMLLPAYRALSLLAIRRRSAERTTFEKAVGRLNLMPRRIDLEARRFSGGNQQKLVIARWLNDTSTCRFMMLDEPTQGVDVGARSDIYNALRASALAGTSILFTSSEPEELVQIADRVIILSHGRPVATLEPHEVEESRLLSLAHNLEISISSANKGRPTL